MEKHLLFGEDSREIGGLGPGVSVKKNFREED
jgi:hypothetical protein